MRQHTIFMFRRAGVACALWICMLLVLRPAAPAQTSQETETEKATKPKRLKKSATEATSSQAPAPAEAAPATGKAPAPVKNATDAEIQAAKAGGMVWVNTGSGVYHKSGKWFGATKQGKFMTEQDAVKAGYRAAKNEK